MTSEIDTRSAICFAVRSSCARIVEHFMREFVRKHQTRQYKGLCDSVMDCEFSSTTIFAHFETCKAVINGKRDCKLGKELNHRLQQELGAPRLEHACSFARFFHEFHETACYHEVFMDNHGRAIIPSDLAPPVKRFLVRYLLSIGHDVIVVSTATWTLREPEGNELEYQSPYRPT